MYLVNFANLSVRHKARTDKFIVELQEASKRIKDAPKEDETKPVNEDEIISNSMLSGRNSNDDYEEDVSKDENKEDVSKDENKEDVSKDENKEDVSNEENKEENKEEKSSE